MLPQFRPAEGESPILSEAHPQPSSPFCTMKSARVLGALKGIGVMSGGLLILCAVATWSISRGADRLSPSQPQAAPTVDHAVPAPWEKSDPMRDCKILWENGGPAFTVPGNGRHDFEALWPIVNQNAPCLVQETSDDFTLDVTVPPHSEGAGPVVKEHELRAAGLVVCSDEDRVVRLLRTGPKSIRAEWYYAGTIQGQQATEIAEGTVHLRLEKRNGGFTFSSSTDKTTWKRFWWAYDFTFGALVKAGAVAINTSKQDFKARLPGLTLTSLGSPLEKEIMSKWTPLFNGTDLTGWKFYPENEKKNKKLKKDANKIEGNEDLVEKPLDDWRVEDGVLVGKGKRRAIFTEKKFENFYFQAEVQINRAANAGIYFRPYSHPNYDGPDSTDFGMQIRGFGSPSFQTYGLGSELNVSTGDGLRYREGRWMTIGFVANGARMMMKQGDETMPASQDRLREVAPGHIALQIWDPDTEIRFRDIKIMELPKLPKDHRLARPETEWMTLRVYNLQFLLDEKKKIFAADHDRFRKERISQQKLIHCECDLIDTQIQWAISKYQHEEYIDLLRKLIPLREHEFRVASTLAETGLETKKNVDRLGIQVADAKARLAASLATEEDKTPPKDGLKKN